MKKIYDIVIAFVLLLFLVIGYFIGNAIIRGILLLLFAAALIVSTILKFRTKRNGKFSSKFFYGILLFLEFILAAGAFYVIVTSIIEA